MVGVSKPAIANIIKLIIFQYSGKELITIYTDQCLHIPLSHSKYNIAWLIESKEISPHLYTNFKIYDKFDYVLTHDAELLTKGSNFESPLRSTSTVTFDPNSPINFSRTCEFFNFTLAIDSP